MYTLYIHVHVSYSNQEPDNVCRESNNISCGVLESPIASVYYWGAGHRPSLCILAQLAKG